MALKNLLNADTSDNPSASFKMNGMNQIAVVVAAANTVTLQCSPDNGTTWINVDNGAFTADATKVVGPGAQGMIYRFDQTGAGPNSAWAGPVQRNASQT